MMFRDPRGLAAGIVVGIAAVGVAAQGGGGGVGNGGGGAIGPSIIINGGAPASSLPPLAKGTGAISGVVTDLAGKAIGEAVVLLRNDNPKVPPQQRAIGQQITDAKGRFVFTDLPASDAYGINTLRSGYFSSTFQGSETNANGTAIVLADGQWFNRADIRLSPTATIGGQVLDEHGEPVVGAYVRVLRQVFIAGGVHLAATQPVVTDDRGQYRISGLDVGKYLVCVPIVQASVPAATSLTFSAQDSNLAADIDAHTRLLVDRYPVPPSGPTPRTYPISCYPDHATLAQAAAIDISHFGDQHMDADIRLVPAPAARIAGRVVASEIPSGMTLRLVAAGSEELGQGGETATALLDKDGSFGFAGVPPGDYLIQARSSNASYTLDVQTGNPFQNLPNPPAVGSYAFSSMGLASSTRGLGLRATTFGRSNPLWGQLAVSVNGRDLSDLVVPVQSAITLTGHIVYEGAEMPTGTPLITADAANGDPTRTRSRVLGANMTPDVFQIDGLLPGQYVLQFRGIDTGKWAVKSIVFDARDYAGAPLDLPTGRDAVDVAVTMTDKVAVLAGNVRESSGTLRTTGDTPASVIIFPADPASWRNFGITPTRIKSTRANNQGGYRFPALAAGDYYVVAVDAAQGNDWQMSSFLESASRVASRVSIGWGEAKTLDLTKASVR